MAEINIVSKKFNKLTESPKFNKNPFVLELKGKMYIQPRANYILAKREAILDKETGILKHDEDVLMGRRKFVDKSQFAKIYASEIGILFELSKTAINVFIFLTKQMDYDNKVLFNYFTEYNKLGYKAYPPVMLGLRELITKNIIAMHEINHVYWLNPKVVCKGERFAIYTEYIAEGDTEKKAMIQNKKLQEQIENLPHNEKLELAKNADLFSSENEKI